MYKSDNYQIADFEILRVSKETGSSFEVILSKGGLINQIYLGNEDRPLLGNFLDQSDIDQNARFKQAILFPFPNRLEDGSYSYNQKTYQFPCNEKARANAIHGFVHDREFVLTSLELFENKAAVELSHIYHGQDNCFPFPFILRIRYEISDSSFTVKASIENTGHQTFPYGFGWHPYFQTDSTAYLRSNPALIQFVNDRMLPTGEEEKYDFGKELELLDESLDSAFRLGNTETIDINLAMFNGKILNMKADKSFKFFQIYNPETNIIAVEPVTCNINALKTGDGLIFLEKGETNQHLIELSIVE